MAQVISHRTTFVFTSAWAANPKIDAVGITWPSGLVQRPQDLSVDCLYTIEEGKGTKCRRTLCGLSHGTAKLHFRKTESLPTTALSLPDHWL